MTARVYAQARQDLGMVAPPLALHSGQPKLLAACWTMLRETLVVPGESGRAVKEAVAAAVSSANGCPYCVEVHESVLNGLKDASPSVAAATAWGRTCVDASTVAPLPAPNRQTGEVVGVAVTFGYLNRMANIFLPSSPVPAQTPGAARKYVRGTLGWMLRGTVGDVTAGRSVDLLPPARPTADVLSWAGGAREVSDAFARASAEIERAADPAVPPAVRAAVREVLEGWTGGPPGPGRGWMDPVVAELPPADRAAGKLALLTALASYRIDDDVVEEYRRDAPGDEALLSLTSWVALTAARRTGEWMTATSPEGSRE
ncbi:carboxymuconolactone decarboxylase family protein [Amycolatopsis sp. WAC 01376]|uniref:carboxymuconolactone decarboxylase family protein n=1 Tax=Amycolatopsis sp. WAC 01376 TaxID=2203195 RepID=UPI0018F60AB1|nr:carboxymuconolactone decarboxylase family protein [Amycolatopsis sp. WAC 01376]